MVDRQPSQYKFTETKKYAPRISDEDWDQHKSFIQHMFKQQTGRVQMLEELQTLGFHPTLKQLRAKLKTWNLPTNHDPQNIEGTVRVDPVQEPASSVGQALSQHRSLATHVVEQEKPSSASCSEDMPRKAAAVLINEPYSVRGLDEEIAAHFRATANIGLSTVNCYWSSFCQYSSLVVKDSQPSRKEKPFTNDPRCLSAIADFLYTMRHFSDAFDFYIIAAQMLVSLGNSKLDLSDPFTAQLIVKCGISMTTEAQVSCMVEILSLAKSHCEDLGFYGLTDCLTTILSTVKIHDPNDNQVAYSGIGLQACNTQSPALFIIATDRDDVLHNTSSSKYQDFCDLMESSQLINAFRSGGKAISSQQYSRFFQWTLDCCSVLHPSSDGDIANHINYLELAYQSSLDREDHVEPPCSHFRATASNSILFVIWSRLIIERVSILSDGVKQHHNESGASPCELEPHEWVDALLRHFTTNIQQRKAINDCYTSINGNSRARIAAVIHELETQVRPVEKFVGLGLNNTFSGFNEHRARHRARENEYRRRQASKSTCAENCRTQDSTTTHSSWSFHRNTGIRKCPSFQREVIDAVPLVAESDLMELDAGRN